MKKQWRYRLVIMLLILSSLTGCNKLRDSISTRQESKTNDSKASDVQITETQFLLGTVVTLQVFGSEDESLLTQSVDIIKEIDQWMSLNIESSEVSQLNKKAGMGPVKISDELEFIIAKAIEYGDLSEGSFDISLEPVVRLWGIGSDAAKVPSEEELTNALKSVNYKNIRLDRQNNTVELQSGMSIDLGGIGKGYVADVVADYLKEQGIKKAILNMGGNIVVIGEKNIDTPFKVGLQNPFSERNAYFGYVEVADESVVTSGIYERNFTENGITYHHILSNVDGYPVQNGVAGVSIVSKRSIDADALSTSLFALGVEKGLALANSLPDVEVLYVTSDTKIHMTEGMKALFTLTDSDFSQ